MVIFKRLILSSLLLALISCNIGEHRVKKSLKDINDKKSDLLVSGYVRKYCKNSFKELPKTVREYIPNIYLDVLKSKISLNPEYLYPIDDSFFNFNEESHDFNDGKPTRRRTIKILPNTEFL